MQITPIENWTAKKLNLSGRVSNSQLWEYQAGKLRETIGRARDESRFYKELLEDIHPEDIRGPEDIARIPFTDPESLAGHFHDFLCVSPAEISRIVTLFTSGTTGPPKRIAFTSEDQESIADFFRCGMTTFADASDRIVIFLPGNTEGSVGDLLKKAVAGLGCTGIVSGPIRDYERASRTLVDEKATCAVGIPSQLLALSRHESAGISKGRICLKSVLLTGDYAARALTDSLRRAWECEVYEHYGMTEMGLGGGVECGAHNGYHTRDADLLFEIIDPVTGRPVKDGEWGEVVFTTLTRRGLPLIRYRTGDRSRFLTGPCPCGSPQKRLERISGRLREAVQLSDGSSLSITRLDEVLYRNPEVSAYTAELAGKDGRERLVLTIKPAGRALNTGEIASDLRLTGIPGALIDRGCLQLDIREGGPECLPDGTSKRYIVDRQIKKNNPG